MFVCHCDLDEAALQIRRKPPSYPNTLLRCLDILYLNLPFPSFPNILCMGRSEGQHNAIVISSKWSPAGPGQGRSITPMDEEEGGPWALSIPIVVIIIVSTKRRRDDRFHDYVQPNVGRIAPEAPKREVQGVTVHSTNFFASIGVAQPPHMTPPFS